MMLFLRMLALIGSMLGAACAVGDDTLIAGGVVDMTEDAVDPVDRSSVDVGDDSHPTRCERPVRVEVLRLEAGTIAIPRYELCVRSPKRDLGDPLP